MTLTPEQFNQLATKDDLKGLVTEQKFQDTTDKVINKLSAVENQLSDAKNQVSAVENQLSTVKNQVTTLENRTEKIEQTTDKVINKLFTLEDRVEKIEQTMVTKQDHNEVMNTLDAVMKKLDTIEHAFVFNQAAHDRFEQRITKIEQRLGINPYNVIANNA